mgnify:FL=1
MRELNNTEEKSKWCEEYGEKTELAFAVGQMHQVGLPTFLNPEKAKDKYAHDLYTIFQTDLKSVRTPLFKAQQLYGIDPQYAVTFNYKDGKRYKDLYPNIVVIFDVHWEDNCRMIINGLSYSVRPMHHVFAGFLTDIREAIIKSGNHRIEYARRVNDESGNAKESYVFDVRNLHRLA